MSKPLTQYAKASGCGCKIQPAVLQEILQGFTLDSASFPNLVLGNSGGDDCSVYDLGDGKYLLQTVDFFTPLVNDAGVFGMAAAANALSDVWAMGGKPIMANAVMGWPIDTLPVSQAREVMQGALEVCNAAGVPLAGGHTIDSPEPMFGLSVTGLVDSANLKTNAGAKAGDVLLLTKPLGLGMLSAAHKRGLTSLEQDEILYKWIVQTNHVGSILGGISGVHAMTDVTGFGLAGHLLELCKASGLGSVLESNKLPRIAEAEIFASQFVLPDNAMRNWNAYEGEIDMRDAGAFAWLVDPQSSGGLLLSVGAASLGEVEAALRAAQCFHQTIGEMVNLISLPDGKLLSVN